MADKRFMCLRDRFGQVPLLDLDTGEVATETKYHKIVGTAGIRRGILQRTSPEFLEETGDIEPITADLAAKLIPYYTTENSWTYDHVHLDTELEGENPELRQQVIDGLCRMMSEFSYDFKVLAVQRRMLWYFSDGNWSSQRRFIRLAPRPDEFPYTKDGKPLAKYLKGPTMAAVQAYMEQMHGGEQTVEYTGPVFNPSDADNKGLAPLLYGPEPAWLVRFTLDGQSPAFNFCKVYVTDPKDCGDGHGLVPQFICSDWCQRSGRDVKYNGGGIDLQAAEYTFATWVTGPCVKRAQDEGQFKPKLMKVKTVQLSSMKDKLVVVPTFEQAYAKFEPAITRLKEQGKSLEETITYLKYDLEGAKKDPARVQQLHDVPMLLDPAQFKPETQEFYKAVRVHAVASKAPFIFLKGYTKPQPDGTLPEFAKVKPQYLIIDEQRVRESYNPPAAFMSPPGEFKPVSPAELREAEAFLQQVLMKKGQRLVATDIEPIALEAPVAVAEPTESF